MGYNLRRLRRSCTSSTRVVRGMDVTVKTKGEQKLIDTYSRQSGIHRQGIETGRDRTMDVCALRLVGDTHVHTLSLLYV